MVLVMNFLGLQPLQFDLYLICPSSKSLKFIYIFQQHNLDSSLTFFNRVICKDSPFDSFLLQIDNNKNSDMEYVLIDIIMLIRKIVGLTRLGYFSNPKIFDGIKSDVAGMENISKMPFYLSFREGLNLTLDNKLEEANKHYQQALNLLEDKKQELKDHYMHIYKKMIMNNYQLKKVKSLEENIYGLIKLKKKSNTQSILLYDDYNSLFQVFLKFNPQKAILLGKALLSEKQVENMSLKHKKLFQFNLANAYFLIGNYQDAKVKYSECLEDQPHDELKVKVYNNLALSCWWNKNPLISEQIVEPSKHKIELIDSDYKQTRQIFLKAIENSQKPDGLNDEQAKYMLKQAINEFQFDINAKFEKRESSLPIFNLVQYYVNNQPNERVKILFWLRALLKVSQINQQEPLFDEAYTTLCLLNNEKANLQSYAPAMLKKYENKIQQIYYLKIMSFLLNSQGKKEEAQNSKLRAVELEKKYQREDPFIFKRKYLAEFQFTI